MLAHHDSGLRATAPRLLGCWLGGACRPCRGAMLQAVQAAHIWWSSRRLPTPAYWRAELAGTRRHLLANSVQIHVHRHFNQNSKDLQLLAQYFRQFKAELATPVSLLLLCSRALLVIDCFSFNALAIRLICD